MSRTFRIIWGGIAGPTVLGVVWSLPFAGGSGFLTLACLNVAVSVSLFALCGGVSHLILRRKRWTRLSQYVGVMFAVGTVVLAAARIALLEWTFRDGGSEFHLGTQVVEGGHITLGGVVLTLLEGMFGGLWLASAFALFWVIAVRPRANDRNDA